MPVSEAQKKASIEYAKKNLKRIPLDVQKSEYDKIKAAADNAGEKVNAYIKGAIEQRISQMSNVAIPLNQSINTNNELQEKLAAALLEHHEALTGYSREYSTNGTARLVLKFKSKAHISDIVIDTFKEILNEYSVLSV